MMVCHGKCEKEESGLGHIGYYKGKKACIICRYTTFENNLVKCYCCGNKYRLKAKNSLYHRKRWEKSMEMLIAVDRKRY